MQNRDRCPPETLRHVLDRSRRQRHHRLTLLSPQPQVRGLLGFPLPRRLITNIYVAHPFVARAFHSLWTGSGPAIPGVIGFREDGALSESGSGTEGAGIGLTILGVTRVGLGLGLGSFGRG